MEVTKLSLWINGLCCWEHQAPSCLGKTLSIEICKGHHTWMSELLHTPGWGKQFDLHCNLIVLLQPDIWKYTTPGLECASLKEEERWVSLYGISHPWSISSCLAVLPPLVNVHGMRNQLKFLKLPTSLYLKKMLFWGEEIVTFIIFMFHCMCLYCCCGICLQCSHIATKGDTSVLDTSVLPLHDWSGHVAEQGGV